MSNTVSRPNFAMHLRAALDAIIADGESITMSQIRAALPVNVADASEASITTLMTNKGWSRAATYAFGRPVITFTRPAPEAA